MRLVLALVALLSSLPVLAGPGACRREDWACVAECVDRRCADACLKERCAKPLDALRECTQQKQCSGEDPKCAAQRCGGKCDAAFGATGKSRAAEVKDPCAAAKGTVPAGLAGDWVVQAASLEPVERKAGADLSPQPRADYAQALRITGQGCFVLQTKLEDATLGQGNLLVVRGWGRVKVTQRDGDDELTLDTRSGDAVGQVCGQQRLIALEAGQFLRPRFRFSIERDVLTLTTLDADQQTFRFERSPPVDLQREP